MQVYQWDINSLMKYEGQLILKTFFILVLFSFPMCSSTFLTKGKLGLAKGCLDVTNFMEFSKL